MAHEHDEPRHNLAFSIALTLNAAFICLEAVFGFWTGSLALLSDAGHNLSDVFGLLLAWGSYNLARLAPSRRRTYGWRGSTILAALFNALILLVATAGILWEAIHRLFSPAVTLPGMTIVAVAGIGIVVNAATALLFLRGGKRDINIRGAFLHMAADAAVSAGVVAAGLAIYFLGWSWIDPATSLLIAAVIFAATWGLLKESINLAVHAVPQNIDPAEVAAYLNELEGITEAHDLHIWAMSTTETSLTVHLVKPEMTNEDEFLHCLKEELHRRFNIGHVTVQIERGGGPACRQAPHDRV